jgi:CMP-N-acetylneuraminic acid synthetase
VKPLCVIPARAGSQRLKGKNLAHLLDRPMIAYTIEAARDSELFDEVFVATESEAIAAVARSHGATVPGLNPPELAADNRTTGEVAAHLHRKLAEEGRDYDVIYCLQPSSPLRTARHVAEAWHAFVAQDVNFLVSATVIDPHYFHWALTDEGGAWRFYFGTKFLKDRLELPDFYRPNGAIKIARAEQFIATGPFFHFFGEPLGTYRMAEEVSVHVATRTDLLLCEAILAEGERHE